jgi:hypothetical protein
MEGSGGDLQDNIYSVECGRRDNYGSVLEAE